MVFDCFFFFKQKTAYEMRISDWSSDVCSSDLAALPARAGGAWLDASRDPSDGARRDPQGRSRGTARVPRDAGTWRAGGRDSPACRPYRRLEAGGPRLLGQPGARNCAPEPLGLDLLPDAVQIGRAHV